MFEFIFWHLRRVDHSIEFATSSLLMSLRLRFVLVNKVNDFPRYASGHGEHSSGDHQCCDVKDWSQIVVKSGLWLDVERRNTVRIVHTGSTVQRLSTELPTNTSTTYQYVLT